MHDANFIINSGFIIGTSRAFKLFIIMVVPTLNGELPNRITGREKQQHTISFILPLLIFQVF